MNMIDKILHFFGQETRFALHQKIDEVKRESAWHQYMHETQCRDFGVEREELQKAIVFRDKWISDNGLTKSQMDKQAEIQLEMDEIRAEFDKGHAAMIAQASKLIEDLNKSRSNNEYSMREIDRLRTELRKEAHIAHQQKSIAEGWQERWQESNNECKRLKEKLNALA